MISSAPTCFIFHDRPFSSRFSLGTKQVCLFRDNYTHLTSTGLSIYGLSADSPKANTTFKTKQNLSYSLLCNPSATLIGAIGFKKAPKGTTRGVFAVDKKGKVLLREAGGPDATVDAVQKLVAQGSAEGEAKEEASNDAEAK
jgi:peroxiredoxin Q/BCP